MEQPKRLRRAHKPLPSDLNDCRLFTAGESAAIRNQGLSTFWRDVARGTVPQPVRITPRAPRWRLSDLIPAA
jgi:predicted DNA-binding transcriptional regulator AlpA